MAVREKILHRVGNMRDIGDNKISKVEVANKSILLVRKGHNIYAIDPVCGEGCMSLCDGVLEGFFIRCPWLHEYYDIRTGQPLGISDCKYGITIYESRVSEANGDIFVYF